MAESFSTADISSVFRSDELKTTESIPLETVDWLESKLIFID